MTLTLLASFNANS